MLMNAEKLSHSEAIAPERRSMRRQRVLKQGRFMFNNGFGVCDCTVKNISETGALVLMEDATGLPTQFDFTIVGGNVNRVASMAWRKNGVAGIKFV